MPNPLLPKSTLSSKDDYHIKPLKKSILAKSDFQPNFFVGCVILYKLICIKKCPYISCSVKPYMFDITIEIISQFSHQCRLIITPSQKHFLPHRKFITVFHITIEKLQHTSLQHGCHVHVPKP